MVAFSHLLLGVAAVVGAAPVAVDMDTLGIPTTVTVSVETPDGVELREAARPRELTFEAPDLEDAGVNAALFRALRAKETKFTTSFASVGESHWMDVEASLEAHIDANVVDLDAHDVRNIKGDGTIVTTGALAKGHLVVGSHDGAHRAHPRASAVARGVRRDRVHLHFNMSWTTVSGS